MSHSSAGFPDHWDHDSTYDNKEADSMSIDAVVQDMINELDKAVVELDKPVVRRKKKIVTAKPVKRIKIVRKRVVVSSPAELFDYLEETGVKKDELVRFFYSDEPDAEAVADGTWERNGSEGFRFTVFTGDHYPEICEAIEEEFDVSDTKYYGANFHGPDVEGGRAFSTYTVQVAG